MNDSIKFYAELPSHSISLPDLLGKENLFTAVPEDWHIVVTDIEGSTQSVADGYHNDINLAATGSIVTALNTAKIIDAKIKLPYFFGGDGATFIVPNQLIEKIISALENYSIHVTENFSLSLRVGSIPVKEAYENKVNLRIAKSRLNKYLTAPIVLGNGLKYAEEKIKERYSSLNVVAENSVNLEGMECRWNEIQPDAPEKRVLCLLISCSEESKQASVFRSILTKMNTIFGGLNERNPITEPKLKLDTSLKNIKSEMYARLGKYNSNYLVSRWFMTKIGKFYFKFIDADEGYFFKVTKLSDTIMLDGFINTVITGTDGQIKEFQFFLDSLETQKKIIYGWHITHASIMSCYVQDRKENHIHFVDGTEGGYTTAAFVFKEKLKSLES